MAAAGFVLCAAATAVAEPPAPPATPSPARSDSPGFLDALNRWFDESASNFKSGMKGTQDTLNDIGNSARQATEAISKIPSARVVTGRELCQNAPNGSPDCRIAAETVCRGKGFTSGKSLDTESAQKCPARLWLSGRLPAEGECAVETHLVRAVCQ